MNQGIRRRKWLGPAAAAMVVVLAAGGVTLWKRGSGPSINYQPVTAARGDLSMDILATGVVQPENRVEIKPPIAGRAERVLIDEGSRVRKGQILVWMSSTERAALLDAAQARGSDEVKRWEELYKPTPILAPITGTVISRNIEPGQTFTSADAILVMSDRLTIQAQVDETDIAQVKLKQQARAVLDAYPNVSIPARVDKIAFDAKTVNSVTTYIVTVVPEETPPFMRSGMTTNVTFLLAARQGALLLPADAIRTQDGRPYVLVQSGDGRGEPRKREVKLGVSDGKRVEILSGLNEGETVLEARYKAGGTGKGPQGSPFSPMGGPRRSH